MRDIKNIILLFAVLSACGSEEKNTEVDSKNFVTEKSKQSEVQESPLNKDIECLAEIKVPPGDRHTIYAKADGYMSNFHWVEGAFIKKGQIIAMMNNPAFSILKKEYKSAKAEWDYENENFERQKYLYESEAISKKEFLIHQKNYNLAQSNYEGLKEEIKSMGFGLKSFENSKNSQLAITSPVSGIISEIHMNAQMKVDPNVHLMSIIDTSHIHIEIAIPEQFSHDIQQGDEFYFISDGEKFIGEVYKINPVIQSNNQFSAHGHFLGSYPKNLLIGQKLFVTFDKVD